MASSSSGVEPSHPTVTIGGMSDDYDEDRPTPEQLQQLAHSLAMDGSLWRLDALRVAEVLREVACQQRRPTRR